MNNVSVLANHLDDDGQPQSASARCQSDTIVMPLEAMASRIVERLVKIALDDIRVRYELGQLVHTACQAKRRASGSTALERLSLTLDVHSTALRRHARVSAMFTQGDLEAVLSLRRPNGLPVTWSHLELFSEVTNRDARWRFVHLAVAEGLSVRALAAQIRDARRRRMSKSSTDSL